MVAVFLVFLILVLSLFSLLCSNSAQFLVFVMDLKNIFDQEKFSAYTASLRSKEFLDLLQSRINYDIETIKKQYLNYVEEAEFGIQLLSKFDLHSKRILEVGSGAGILTAWLLMNGADIIGIEPSALGFAFHEDIFSTIWEHYKLPDKKVFDLSAEQLDPAVVGKFDLIFSLNVMEHIPPANLELVFSKMRSVMTETGAMYHHCPNYIIPFEPHYGLPLVPFFPQLTGKLKGVAKEDLWASVNFITLPQVKKIAKNLGLEVSFKKNVMKETFTRLEFDKQFASRHLFLVKVYKVMKAVGIISLLGLIPPVLSTPMTYTLTFKK